MGLRATKTATRQPTPGVAPGRIPRPGVLVLSLSILLLSASQVAAQRSATARAVVHVPTVSQLDVQPVSSSPASSSDTRTGLLRVRVRANHHWKVIVAVPAGLDEPVWVRVAGSGEGGSYRLEPGAETVIAAGDGGETEVRVEYRWDAAESDEQAVPLTYTLASL